MSDDTLSILESHARDARLFRHYPFPDGPMMTSDTPLKYVGVLKGDTLKIFRVGSARESKALIYSLKTEKGDIDIGYAAPAGLMYIPARALPTDDGNSFVFWKMVHVGASDYHFQNIIPRRKKKSAEGEGEAAATAAKTDSAELEEFFILLEADPAGDHAKLHTLIAGSGALIWNGTGPPPEGFLGLSIEMSDSLRYEVRFVQRCVDFGRQHVLNSRARLEELQALAEAGKGPEWDKTVKRLRRMGLYYFELRKLRDLIAHLVFLDLLRAAGTTPGLWTFKYRRKPGLSDETKALLEKLKVDGLDKLEDKLVIEGKKYTLTEFRDYLDKLTKMVKSRAPLLGRLDWEALKPELTDAQVEAGLQVRLKFLALELLTANRRAHDMLGLSMDRIRTPLGSNSPLPVPVVHIPKIWETVKKREKPELDADPLYFWAVEKMEWNQKAMPFVMAAMELFIGFFCPPVGLLLGIGTAFLDDEEATFKEALADADYDEGKALVSKAEAESARFWANVGAVLTVLGGIGDVLDTARILGKAAKNADEVSDLAKVLDDAVPESAEGAKVLDELGEATEAASDTRRLDEAFDSDVKEGLAKTEKAASDAKADGIVGKDTGRLSATADLDDAVRAVPEKLRKLAGDDFDDLRDKWLSYARSRRTKIAEGLDETEPRKFELWLLPEIRKARISRLPPPPKAKRQRSFLHYLVRYRGKFPDTDVILGVLDDLPKLRDRIKEMRTWGKISDMAENWSDGERALFRALAEAGDSLDDAGIDRLIRTHLLDPLDALKTKVGGDRKLAVFMGNLPGGAALADKAGIPEALSKLLKHADVDELRLDSILGRELYTPFQERLIRAMDAARAQELEGVFAGIETSSKSKKTRGLFERLDKAQSRGAVMEMLTVGELAEHLPKGSKIIVGKEFDDLAWLNSLILEHGKAGKGSLKNLVDADILVQFPDGKKVLIDTKWTDVVDTFHRTKEETLEAMHRHVIFQIYKYERAVAEGIADRAEFWLSHHLADGMMDLDTLKALARRLSGDNVRFLSGVMEDPDFMKKFVDESMLGPSAARIRPEVPPTTVIPDKALEVVKTAPPAALPPPSRLPVSTVDPPPAPTSASVLESVRRVNDLVVVGESGTIAVSSRVARMTIRLPPVGKEAEPITVKASRLALPGDGLVKQMDLWRAPPDARIGGRTSAEIAASSIEPADRTAILAALDRGDTFGLAPVIDPRPYPKPGERFGSRQLARASGALHVVAWRAEVPIVLGESTLHLHIYEGTGRLMLRHPVDGELTLKSGWDFVAFVPLYSWGRGSYRVVLNINESFSSYSHDVSLAVT